MIDDKNEKDESGTEINWEDIAAQLPKEQDTRIQTSKLPNREYWMLKAASSAMYRKLAHNSQSLLVAQILRHWPEWRENIAFLAAQQGCSFEAMFLRLVGEADEDSKN